MGGTGRRGRKKIEPSEPGTRRTFSKRLLGERKEKRQILGCGHLIKIPKQQFSFSRADCSHHGRCPYRKPKTDSGRRIGSSVLRNGLIQTFSETLVTLARIQDQIFKTETSFDSGLLSFPPLSARKPLIRGFWSCVITVAGRPGQHVAG